jgi:type VI secretion system protein ImpL
LRDDLEVHLRAMLELEPGHQPSFEPNGTLIQSAQTTLTRLSIADQAYSYLRSLPPEVPIDDFNVAARLGADAQTVFETVDGSDFNALTIPAFFTYRGFHEHLLSELSSIADRLKGELWVRGEPGTAMVTDEQFAQLGPQLLALYSKDFVAAWSGMLDNLKLKTLPGEKPDYIALSVASNPATSPIKLLVEAVAAETALTKEPPEPEPEAANPLGDVATPGSPAALALAAATQRAGGLAKIGIAMALKKSDARPGDPGTVQQLPGANIEAQFKDYSVLVDGSPKPIDGVIENLNEVYRNLVIAARNPSQAPQATTAAQLGVSTLSVNASRFPTAMRRILSGAVSDLEGDAAGTSLAQLNQSLASQVTRICEQFTANLYPFSSNSQRDVPMADFARLFAPNGVLDKFFTENLATLADLSGDNWTWRTDTALGRELSNASLREFQRAAQIRDAFFPPNAVEPSVSLTIQQVSLNPAADMALLDINGTVYQGQQVGSAQVTMQWPTSQGTGVVNLTMTPELPGRESSVSIQGPWALMRLIDRNTVSRRGDELRLRIVIGGRDVDYAIRVGTLFNPFFLPALSEFSCPSGL